MYLPAAGHCLLIPSGPSLHLHFVLCDPTTIHGYGTNHHVVLVNATSLDPTLPYDASCVLNAGCHPFITHESFIAYRWAKFESCNHIGAMVASNFWKISSTCDTTLIQKISAGACVSKLAARDLKLFLKCPGVLPRH